MLVIGNGVESSSAERAVDGDLVEGGLDKG
jgi:hypothetical protein